MPDFNNLEPKKDVTDPKGLGLAPYPRHVHKFVAVAKASDVPDGAMVVAWDKKQPIYNEYLVVGSVEAHEAATADGWADSPVLSADDSGKKDSGKKGK